MGLQPNSSEKILRAVERQREDLLALAADLVRVPTVNPPGENYRPCVEVAGRWLADRGFEVEYLTATESAEHSDAFPRTNALAVRKGSESGPVVHLNGHIDVVPVGLGWTVDPFGALVKDGRMYGRGTADMKCGLASAMVAAEALRMADVALKGTVEVSATVDEESGGFAGVAYLAEIGRIAAGRTDHVVIPEPLNVDRVCIGHRGVYWFEVKALGHVAHGSMPFLGVNAIDAMSALIETFRRRLGVQLEKRTTAMPVTPKAARRGSLNTNSIVGGQAMEEPQTPCVADVCVAVFDRRFLVEESLASVRREIQECLSETQSSFPGASFEWTDRMTVEPTLTAASDPLVRSLERSIKEVVGATPELVASPGTYDHKHVARIASVPSCVAYGPGVLEQAHQPDEWCGVEDMVKAAGVMALTLAELVG